MGRRLGALLLGAVLLAGCGSSEEDDPVVGPDVPEPSSALSSSQPPPAGPVVPGSLPENSVIAPADLGAEWSTAEPDPPPCAPALAPEGTRSAGLRQAGGRLTEALFSGLEVEPAVRAWRASLERCGYAVSELLLGDAGITARSGDGTHTVVVTGTEGVVVVLHLTGEIAKATDELEGWADLALGTSCEAAPDGCH